MLCDMSYSTKFFSSGLFQSFVLGMVLLNGRVYGVVCWRVEAGVVLLSVVWTDWGALCDLNKVC
jgi:hypothetical protein